MTLKPDFADLRRVDRHKHTVVGRYLAGAGAALLLWHHCGTFRGDAGKPAGAGDVGQLHLQEAIKMADSKLGQVGEPRRAKRGAFLVAGLIGSFDHDNVQAIPDL